MHGLRVRVTPVFSVGKTNAWKEYPWHLASSASATSTLPKCPWHLASSAGSTSTDMSAHDTTWTLAGSTMMAISTVHKEEEATLEMLLLAWDKNKGLSGLNILLSISACLDYEIWQMDVKTTFLNGYLEECIYM